MIGYYRFDGNVYDEISRTNASATNVTYEYDYIKFSGTSSYLELNEANSVRNANAATVSLWLYMESYSTQPYYPISETNSGYGYNKINICIDTNGKISAGCRNNVSGDSGSFINLSTNENFPLQSWHFLCGIYDLENGQLKIYLDDRLIGTKEISVSSFTNSTYKRKINEFDNGSNNINTAIDELTIWKRALTDDEVNKLYRMRIDNKVLMMPTQNLAFYASLNGKTPNVAETGQSITTSCNFIQKSGIKCGSFENNENMVLIPSSYSILGNSLPYTISFWYYLESEKTNYAYGFLYTVYDSSGNDNDKLAFMIRPHMNGITVGGRMYNDVNAPQNIIEYDKWIHFVSVIYSNKVELYFNNVKYELSRNQNFYNQQIYFGYAPYTDYNRSGINGCISSIRIYNKALTGREISILSKEFKKFKKNAIPEEGLIFYDSLKTNVNVCETGQVLSKTGTITYQEYNGIPCAYFNQSYINSQTEILDSVKNFTISCFFNQNDKYNTDPQTIYCTGPYNENYNGACLFIWNTGQIVFTNIGQDINTNYFIQMNTWYHIAVIVNNNYISIFINGNKIVDSNYLNMNNVKLYPLSVGSWLRDNKSYFNGYISSVRIYDRVLTQDEITKLSNEF